MKNGADVGMWGCGMDRKVNRKFNMEVLTSKTTTFFCLEYFLNERLLFVNSSTNQIGILFSGCFGSIGIQIYSIQIHM